MRHLYQREWFGIPFSSFTRVSPQELADAVFYQAFYQVFFQRYGSWDDLDLAWRDQKAAIARFILERVKPGQRLLSIGCGLGWIEHCLLELSHGGLHLEVTEVADTALKWLRAELPPASLHIGEFPACLPDVSYDLIYMLALDYCLDQPALISLLSQAGPFLAEGGRFLVISASFDEPQPAWRRAIRVVRHTAAVMLEMAGRYHRGQFWGWGRTREDYQQALTWAGYGKIRDGFVPPAAQETGAYWIEGRLP